ncbi:hypothetical protein RRSWK_05255 [Rhodopirellula sp. SWK7]|nr:hypothetical protein RRSWK_05255 [Rhodopirellula sp. SWK7]
MEARATSRGRSDISEHSRTRMNGVRLSFTSVQIVPTYPCHHGI